MAEQNSNQATPTATPATQTTTPATQTATPVRIDTSSDVYFFKGGEDGPLKTKGGK